MRKLVSLTLFVFILNITAQAQDKFRFGLHFSPNLGWIKPDTKGYSKDGANLGFSYGLIAEFNLSERYAFLTGLNVARVSGSNTYTPQVTGFGSPTEFTVTTQYVEIPLALKLKTNEIGYLKYFGKFGLSPSVAFRSHYDTESSEEIDYQKQTQPVRLALLVGLGAEFNISGNTSLLFGVDFNNGFTNLYTNKAGYTLPDGTAVDVKGVSNYISLNLGVLF